MKRSDKIGAVMMMLASLAGCGPGDGSPDPTDGGTTGKTTTTSGETTDAPTSATVTTDEPTGATVTGGSTGTTGSDDSTSTTEDATETSTGTTGGAMGCVGDDPEACAASTPFGGRTNGCLWVEAHVVQVVDTICTATELPGRCIEVENIDGGPQCDGQFAGHPDGVQLYTPGSCEELQGWSTCFENFDFEMLGDPACICIAPQYCPGQPDEATCMMASHALQTCTWQDGACQ